jgi:hypothetical protein
LCAVLHRQPLLIRHALQSLSDKRGFEFRDLEKVVAAVRAAALAFDFCAVQPLVSPEFRLPSGSDLQYVLELRHQSFARRGKAAASVAINNCNRSDTLSLLQLQRIPQAAIYHEDLSKAITALRVAYDHRP